MFWKTVADDISLSVYLRNCVSSVNMSWEEYLIWPKKKEKKKRVWAMCVLRSGCWFLFSGFRFQYKGSALPECRLERQGARRYSILRVSVSPSHFPHWALMWPLSLKPSHLLCWWVGPFSSALEDAFPRSGSSSVCVSEGLPWVLDNRTLCPFVRVEELYHESQFRNCTLSCHRLTN